MQKELNLTQSEFGQPVARNPAWPFPEPEVTMNASPAASASTTSATNRAISIQATNWTRVESDEAEELASLNVAKDPSPPPLPQTEEVPLSSEVVPNQEDASFYYETLAELVDINQQLNHQFDNLQGRADVLFTKLDKLKAEWAEVLAEIEFKFAQLSIDDDSE